MENLLNIFLNKIGTKKPPNFLSGFSYFAPSNIVLSNKFNEELLKFATYYECLETSRVP